MIVIFIVGWFSSTAVSSIVNQSETTSEQPSNEFTVLDMVTQGLGATPKDRMSPFDRIEESQIHVYNDKIVIDLEGAEWASFTDTNSMDPVIDQGSNAIQIVPKSEDEIHIGDIVSYKHPDADGTIIHRVIKIGYDSVGWYAIMKGDNLVADDPGKVRFDQVKRVLVAVIY